MGEPTRRAWSRPELIVLVRSGPEEAVLTICKVAVPLVGLGPTWANQSCYVNGPSCVKGCDEQTVS